MRTNIKSFIMCFICTVLVSVSVCAQTPSGIHIEAGTRKVVIFLNGNQMSIPTQSCFIANLATGKYLLQVYDASILYSGRRISSAKPLHRQIINYRAGKSVKVNIADLNMPNYGDHLKDGLGGYLDDEFEDEFEDEFKDRLEDKLEDEFKDRLKDEYGDMGLFPLYHHKGVMSQAVFNQFLATLKNAKWDSDREDLIKTAALTSKFTCQQCLSIMKLYRFDDDKQDFIEDVYPLIIDKENIIILLSGFEYEYSKDKLRDFLKKQSAR